MGVGNFEGNWAEVGVKSLEAEVVQSLLGSLGVEAEEGDRGLSGLF